MKKLLVSIFAMLFCVFTISAQELPKIIPPSPNAASLGKYVEVPVSMATGIPNISVPIYNITEGNINLPISLSYHAGGHKVEEVASWVGLGWSLNAGGVVSRTTIGLPDDNGAGYMYSSKTVQQLRAMNYTSSAFHDYANGSIDGTYDFEPDSFSYNIGGVTGRFFYDQSTNKFVQTPKSNVDISYTVGSNGKEIVSWVLTTPDGTKYYMGKSKDGLRTGRNQNSANSVISYANNQYSIPGESYSPPTHYTSWYVMDIVSSKGDNVKFSYNTQLISQFTKTSEQYIKANSCSNKGFSASFSQSLVAQKILDKIEFTGGYVEFNENSTTRSDLSGSKALKSIKVYEGTTLKKEFELGHSYTVSSVETGKWTSLGDANKRRYRLRLNSVTEKNANGDSKPPYSFTYNSTALPSRFSNAQDFWGYYNGMTTNTDLIPSTKLTYSTPIILSGADRTVDTNVSKAGVLTKITYPTGGFAEYFYENNTASVLHTNSGSDYNIRNRYVNGSDPHPTYKITGGLRVYKTKLNDGEGNIIEKNYSYNLFGQSLTSGFMISTPTFLDMEFYNSSCNPGQNVPKITSYSQVPGVMVNGYSVGYSNVTESVTNGGKSEYTYLSTGNFGHYNSYGDILLPDVYASWTRGQLIKKEDYAYNNSTYTKVQSVENEYERVSTTWYQHAGFKSLSLISGSSTSNIGFYSSMTEYHRLKKTITTSYNSTGNVVSTQNYIYNNNPLLASETTTTDSRGLTLKTKTFYPDDVTTTSSLGADNLTGPEKSIIDRMKTGVLHMQGVPIQTEVYKNNVLLSRQRTLFIEPTTGFIAPQVIQTSKGGGALEDRITFHSYYSSGNVKEVSKKDGTHVVYIWGYNQTKPIAKIDNITYSQIQNSVSNLQNLSNADNDRTYGNAGNEGALRTALETLRTSLPSDAVMTYYTYDPLIGVTSTTDPRGRTTYYHYDSFGRLQYVRDHDNKILTKNEYNYKN